MTDHNSTLTNIFAEHGIKSIEEENKSYRQIKISGTVYRLKLLCGKKGFTTALKLKKIALPLIGRGVDGLKSDDFIETPTTFTDMAMLLSNILDEQDMEDLVFNTLLKDVQIVTDKGSTNIDWDEHLMGNYACLIPLLTFSLQENFSSFFTESGMMKGILDRVSKMWRNQEET